MSKVTQKIMMRKTKATLISMLEEQRQIIRETKADRDSWKNRANIRKNTIDAWIEDYEECEDKCTVLKDRIATLDGMLRNKDQEINSLKNAYMDKLELLVELYGKQ